MDKNQVIESEKYFNEIENLIEKYEAYEIFKVYDLLRKERKKTLKTQEEKDNSEIKIKELYKLLEYYSDEEDEEFEDEEFEDEKISKEMLEYFADIDYDEIDDEIDELLNSDISKVVRETETIKNSVKRARIRKGLENNKLTEKEELEKLKREEAEFEKKYKNNYKVANSKYQKAVLEGEDDE